METSEHLPTFLAEGRQHLHELNLAIDLYVNGRRFATGRLMVVDGSDWAVRIETVLEPSAGGPGDGTEPETEAAAWPES